MTVDSLHPGIRAWLVTKGITEDAQIKALEEKGDSLTHALLMFMVTLPYRPKEYRVPGRRPKIPRSLRQSGKHFDKQKLAEVRTLYQDIWKSRSSQSSSSSLQDSFHKSKYTQKSHDSQSFLLQDQNESGEIIPSLDDLLVFVEFHDVETDDENYGYQQLSQPQRTWSGSVQSAVELTRRLGMVQGRKHSGTWSYNALRVFVHEHIQLRIPDEKQEG